MVRGLFEECDARLVTEGAATFLDGASLGEGSLSSGVSVATPAPSVTSQASLFNMRKEGP